HDIAETAADMADQHARQRHQPLRDATSLHQLAGENEEWNGEQREVVDAAEHPTGDDPQRRAFVEPQADERRSPQCKGNRNTDEDEGGEERERRRHGCSYSPPAPSAGDEGAWGSRTSRICTQGARMTWIKMWNSMRPAPTGSAR